MQCFYFVPHVTSKYGPVNLAIRARSGPLDNEQIQKGIIDSVRGEYPSGLIVCLQWDDREICEISEKEYREISQMEFVEAAGY